MRQSTIFTVLNALFLSVLVTAVNTSIESFAGEGEAINPYPGSCHYGGNDMLRVPKRYGFKCHEKILVEAQSTNFGPLTATGTVGDICAESATDCALEEIGIALDLFRQLDGNVGQLLNVVFHPED